MSYNNKIIKLCYTHYKSIKVGGIPVLIKKFILLIKLFIKFPLYFIAVPIVAFIHLLRPFILIRFGVLRSTAIGNHVFDVELYLSERDHYNLQYFDLFFYNNKEMTNQHWPVMVNRVIKLHPFVRYLYDVN